MSKKSPPSKDRDVFLFNSTDETLRAIENLEPFSPFIYKGDVLEKQLRELNSLFTELAEGDRLKALKFVRSLKKAENTTSSGEGNYADHKPGEPIDDYIIRKGLQPPAYPKDGKIIEFLRANYRDKGLLDGVFFTRATLRKLDPGADQALQNWLRKNDTLPDDLDIPTKRGQADRLVEELTPEQLLAASTVIKNRHRYSGPR